MRDASARIRAAEVVLPCAELEPAIAFFTERLGFRVASVFPADQPRVTVLEGHGVRLRLERQASGAAPVGADPAVLRLLCEDPRALLDGQGELRAPNGTRIELAAWKPPIELPALVPSFVLTRMRVPPGWGRGRAGMLYRDLIPGRQGGHIVASHILVRDGGPVPDYVHFHRVRFQLIYCYKGWVRVVYEDQGPAFVMQAGDCVLQPPEIRHRVLESSPGLEVIEIACPAEHETLADPKLDLPSAAHRPEREFGGQRFMWHRAAAAAWQPGAGLEARDLGLAQATGGLVTARVCRWPAGGSARLRSHGAELTFGFVLSGEATLDREGHPAEPLGPADAFVVPGGGGCAIRDVSAGLELLELALPAGSHGFGC